MGYAQELNRKMGWFSNFAIWFSIISILAGAMTTYWLGMQAGGPRAIMLGWIIVGFFALLVGMSMARDLLELPDGRRPLLLVGEVGAQERAGVELVHRVVQPRRPDRCHRLRRLRAGHLHRLLHPALRAELQPLGEEHLHHLRHLARGPRTPEHLPGRRRRAARRHQRVVARRRRAHHLRRPPHRAEPPPERELPLQVEEPHRAGRVRSPGSTCSASAYCSRSTRSPGSTRRRTSARRRTARTPKRRRRSSRDLRLGDRRLRPEPRHDPRHPEGHVRGRRRQSAGVQPHRARSGSTRLPS